MANKSSISSMKASLITTSLFTPVYSILHNQYFTGFSFKKTFSHLYNDNGFRRFYRGFPYILSYVGLLRGGEAFCHEYLTHKYKDKLNLIEINSIGSLCSTILKLGLHPLNTIAIHKQILGKFDSNNFRLTKLYSGYLYNVPGIYLSNFIWFGCIRLYPKYIKKTFNSDNIYLVNGLSGCLASITTDLCINPIKVLKTNRQISKKKILTGENLFKNFKILYRGIKTRLIFTSIYGFIFSILWKRTI